MPRPSTAHLTDQQRHARAGRAQTPLPPIGAGDKARHNRTSNARKLPVGGSATDLTRNDIFDSTGKFVKSEPGNHKLGYSTIYIQLGSTRLKLTEAFAAAGPTRIHMLRDITLHYAQEVGITGLVGIGRTSEVNALAFYNPISKVIAVTFVGNHLDTALNNPHVFKSSLEHEKGHAFNAAHRIPDQIGIAHADVYIAQFRKSDFMEAPLLFRERIAVGMITKLLQDPSVSIEDAQAYIESNHQLLQKAGLRLRLFDIYGNPSLTEYQLNSRPRKTVPFKN